MLSLTQLGAMSDPDVAQLGQRVFSLILTSPRSNGEAVAIFEVVSDRADQDAVAQNAITRGANPQGVLESLRFARARHTGNGKPFPLWAKVAIGLGAVAAAGGGIYLVRKG
ncbi:hypothetical protein LCGC14_1144660 [marine sediment metagenome]|uniref:Transmembrane protein n=1 Tax=marine sediment metagenome TaxID=412755 RepID=A0A0F9MKD3_9ZZZZ